MKPRPWWANRAELPWGEQIVALVTHPDGTVLDVIRNIRDEA